MRDAWEGIRAVVLHPGYASYDGVSAWTSHQDLRSLYRVPDRVFTQVCPACDIPGRESETHCAEKKYTDLSIIHLFPRDDQDYAEWLEMVLESRRAKQSYDELKGRLPSLIGDEIVQLDDGTFAWAPYPKEGGWLAWHLRVIASYLDDLYRKATEEGV